MVRTNKKVKVVSYVSHPFGGFTAVFMVYAKPEGNLIAHGASHPFSSKDQAISFRNDVFENYGFAIKQ